MAYLFGWATGRFRIVADDSSGPVTIGCLEWSKELPTVEGLYRMYIEYKNPDHNFSAWEELVSEHGVLCVLCNDYSEPLNEYVEDKTIVSIWWLGPLPEPELPKG